MAFQSVTDIQTLRRAGPLMAVEVGELKLVLVRIDDGIYAYDDACPHHGVPLSEGMLQGRVLTCRWHQWSFDACSGAGIAPPIACLRRYEVRVEGDVVQVDPERLLPSPRPVFPERIRL